MNEREKKYSLIIPHYKDIVRLRRLLVSLPKRNDLQIIVVDDFSVNILDLKKLENEFDNLEIYQLPSNQGAGAARNFGLAQAIGKYLLFADADDEFLTGAFDIFDSKLIVEGDVFYFLSKAIQEISGLHSIRADYFNQLCIEYLEDETENKLLNLKLGHCVPWSKVYLRDFIVSTKIIFDETFVANDVYFNVINALLAKRIFVFNDYVYKVYRLSDSLSSTSSASRLITRVSVLAKVARKRKELGIVEKMYGSGYLLDAAKFGFPTFCKIFLIILRSDLHFGLMRFFEPTRWIKYLKNRSTLSAEKK
ncbi:glycosyltransferase involved in cell wall biosynthesis [Kerstersia gyiorum]|uniref:Glycosyltransferase involved in cell wall biosynthesis n=1 Tax=Kerstersia gyiorum TaxID=206506 RepID=A0A4Q7ML37_9BURK|nr:glycosyltransferase family 2 protein [Kerstersia gyiorum]KAB0542989.1 glycosyltransferase family 2 protein [Kerstersia gyiorum]RZS67482.1 glycosyltransferase involved in cell wall biosynthesis [Kerstersia gyiorum]